MILTLFLQTWAGLSPDQGLEHGRDWQRSKTIERKEKQAQKAAPCYTGMNYVLARERSLNNYSQACCCFSIHTQTTNKNRRRHQGASGFLARNHACINLTTPESPDVSPSAHRPNVNKTNTFFLRPHQTNGNGYFAMLIRSICIKITQFLYNIN